MSDKWPVDRSRYLEGFVCAWKRLLHYHAFGKGIERAGSLYAPIETGLSVHKGLELVLKHKATTREEVSNLIGDPIKDYVEKLIDVSFENPLDEIAQQVALVEALVHAYTRITVPWINENFELIAVEDPKAVELPGGYVWRSREDFATRSKSTGALAIHDFKTSAYWNDGDTTQWADSLQQMLNAFVASQVYGERVTHYYIHILVKGTKKSPSYLTHPTYRPANPPFQTEDILPYYTAKKGYARVFAPQIPLFIPEWVWTMPQEHAAKAVPIVGPFEVNYAKVERFLAGLPRNEDSWRDRLGVVPDWDNWAQPAFQRKLDELFPRTFNCYEFGGRKCQFYSICHHGPNWQDPLGSGDYRLRPLNHTIAEEDE